MNQRGKPKSDAPKSPNTPSRMITNKVQILPRGSRKPPAPGALELQEPQEKWSIILHPPKAPAGQPAQPLGAAPVGQPVQPLGAVTDSKHAPVHRAPDTNTLGVPFDAKDHEPAPELVAAPKGKKINKYSAQSYYAGLSMQRNEETGCFGFFSNQNLIAELSRKMKIWEENQNEMEYLPLAAQKHLVDDLYKAEVLNKQYEIAKRNFSDDPTGEIVDKLKRELRNYIMDDKRSQSNTKVLCGDEKNVTAGLAKQTLLTELQIKLRERDPMLSILKIINDWKLEPTKYKKPGTNIYFTNYEFVCIKTGNSDPDAKKLIDKYVALLSAQAVARNTPKP